MLFGLLVPLVWIRLPATADPGRLITAAWIVAASLATSLALLGAILLAPGHW